MDKLVTIKSVTKNYFLGKQTSSALRGVSLNIERGEFLAISGPSGSGKTTLLNLIGCIETPTQGSVIIDGVDVGTLSSDQSAELKMNKIGFVFQNFNLLPVLTALENVEYPLFLKHVPKLQVRERARKALADVGLATRENHKPMEMSGGQRQRVAIARAIVSQPQLVLADEPTANLDHSTGLEILDLMKSINVANQTTFIFATHDPKVIAKASRNVSMIDGLIEGDK